MNCDDLLTFILANSVDISEIEHLLLPFYGSGSVLGTEVTYQKQGAEPALRLLLGPGGALDAIKPGPSLATHDLPILRDQIAEHILTPGPTQITRCMLFAGVPTVGAYRFKDEFQILPVPSNAPQTDTIFLGKHPLLLEVSFVSSANSVITMARRLKWERKYELLCSLLIVPWLHGQSISPEFHWVLQNVGEQFTSEYRQGGYTWPGLNLINDRFSDVTAFEPIRTKPVSTYYASCLPGKNDVLEVPDTLTASLEKFQKLSFDDQERFIRACYWRQKSEQVWTISRSISITCLVSAIESLIKGNPCKRSKAGGEKAGRTEKFVEFVSTYAPSTVANESARKRLYSLRSAIAHGGKLLHQDQSLWGMGYQSIGEAGEMQALAEITRNSLYKWLNSLGN